MEAFLVKLVFTLDPRDERRRQSLAVRLRVVGCCSPLTVNWSELADGSVIDYQNWSAINNQLIDYRPVARLVVTASQPVCLQSILAFR